MPDWRLAVLARAYLHVSFTVGVVGRLNPKNKVDLTNPEYTVIVEVIKSVSCVSVVKDYMLFRKFNLQEVVRPEQERKPSGPPDGAPQPPGGGVEEGAKTGAAAEDQDKQMGLGEEEEAEKAAALKGESGGGAGDAAGLQQWGTRGRQTSSLA